MNECANCGETVTDDYRRVFADNDGTLHGCRHCRTSGSMMEGAGAGTDREAGL